MREAAILLVLACACAHGGARGADVRGRAALARGDYSLARRELARAVERVPTDAASWRDLARAELRSGRVLEARTAIARAAKLTPNDVSIVLLRGQILFAGGDRDGARIDAESVLERSRNVRELEEDAILLLRLGLSEQAILAGSRAVERSGGAAAAYNNLAVLAVEARDLDAASRAFAQGRRRHPKDVPLAEAEAAFMVATGRVDAARAAYRELLPRHGHPELVHLALALLAHDRGDLDDALGHAERAVGLAGEERADVHYTLCVVLRDRGELERARQQLRRARARFPADDDLAGLEAALGR